MGHSTAARRFLVASSVAALLSACVSVPDLGVRPTLKAPETLETTQSFVAAQQQWPSDRWWEGYASVELTALIEEALSDSPTLAVAAARLAKAQSDAQQAGAARKPSLSAQSSAQASRREMSSGDAPGGFDLRAQDGWTTDASTAATLQYQLDFFGRNRASFAAATSRAEAAEAESAAARLQISTAVALSYAAFLGQCADEAALQEAVRLREASLVLVTQRVEAHIENEGEAHQARAELAQAQADLFAVRGAILRSRHELAALLGKGPDRGLEITMPENLRLSPTGLPAHVALDLVGRRPDLVAARLRAESAGHRIDVARADFYPNVNLMAVIGLQSFSIDRLGGGDLAFAQVGPAVSLPIFSGGRLEGAYRGARADYDEAVGLYDETLTNALREVADAVSDTRALTLQLKAQREALDAAQAAYRVAQLRYQSGIISYVDTLTSESRLIAQMRTVADLEARGFALDITLVRALGGGYART